MSSKLNRALPLKMLHNISLSIILTLLLVGAAPEPAPDPNFIKDFGKDLTFLLLSRRKIRKIES
jgi:hypothetical protein